MYSNFDIKFRRKIIMKWTIEKQERLYELFLKAINSDNADYIKEQLSRLYTMIYSNNIDTTEMRRLEEDI
jgi:hypothetical protein